jgi:nucleoside-diphosphate-sugar epimerase
VTEACSLYAGDDREEWEDFQAYKFRSIILDRAKKLINYEPKIEFQEGLMNTIRWFKDNWENIERSASFGPGISSAVRDK